MKKIISKIIILISLISMFGCSAFKHHNQIITVSCVPNNATIIVNGQQYGSKSQISVKRDEIVVIQAYKEGYMSHQEIIDHHFSGVGFLDAVGTFWFILPVFGLLTPGAWTLDVTNIGIILDRE